MLAAGCLGARIGKLSDRPGHLWKGGVLAAVLGLVLALVNAARPVAVIGLIAMFLYLFFLCPLGHRREMVYRLVLCCVAALCFFIATKANTALFTARMGVAPPTSVGYNLAVGFNWESKGVWNMSDSIQVGEDMAACRPDGKFDPVMVQALWKERFLDRIQGHSITEFIQLFYYKLRTLIGSDSGSLIYMEFSTGNARIIRILSNGAWLGLWLLSGWAGIRLLRRKLSLAFSIPALFLLGLIMAHMLVEVAVRYHYSMVPALILLAVAGAMPERARN
jgi:hypothetical protein